ncbi:MAG: gamma-glutamyltransferase family protein [Acidobacteria bacterium]|nr:gamma-glutamyltransferase family protein [Acidobacteriota bacterium]
MTRRFVNTSFVLLLSGACFAQQLMHWPVRGTREMVGAANNFEVEAGFRMLAQGGNAIDAGVAAALAAAVTEQARFGLGGEMPLIIKMKGKPVRIVSGVGIAPKLATPEFYAKRPPEAWEDAQRMSPIPAVGILAAITPGVFDGLMLALETYGTKSFADVVAPAIEYADGFPIGEEYANFIFTHQRLIQMWPTSRDYFFVNGQPPPVGSLFRQPVIAKTLRELAAVEKKARGNRAKKIMAVRDYFYKGPIAKRIAQFSEGNGGLIRYEDMVASRASFDEPVTGTYRGYTIVKPGFWTQGPVMIQALQLLEGYDLKAMGHNSPQYLHTVIEAVKLAFADRDRYYGDPKFSTIPAETLLSAGYVATRRRMIDPARASMDHRPGVIAGVAPLPSAARRSSDQKDNEYATDTTSVDVVDRWGNAFSATPSGAWLPSVIAGDTGIPLSTRGQSFVVTEGHANRIGPGKRPRVTLSPTMVLKDGEPFLIMSTPGGDNQDQAMVQVLLNIIEFGMNAQQAAEAPRFQTEHFYTSFATHEFAPGRVNLERRIPAQTIDALKALGHQVEVRGDWSNGSAPVMIMIRDGVLDGGADPRRGRYIFGR